MSTRKFNLADPNGAVDALSAYGEEKWGTPLKVLATSGVVSLLMLFIFYYQSVPFFETPDETHSSQGMLSTSSEIVKFGDGFFNCLAAALAIFAASGSLSLCFEKNQSAMVVGVLAVLLLSIIYYLTIASARDLKEMSYLVWSIVAVVGILAVLGYSVWILMKWVQTLQGSSGKSLQDEEAKPSSELKALKSRLSTAYVLAVVGVLSLIYLVYYHWKVYDAIKVENSE